MKTYNTPEGYNDHDYQSAVAFLEQTDEEGVKNGEKLSDNYDPADPTTWGVCEWEKGRLFRFKPQGDTTTLAGTLDLSDCTALEHLFCVYNNLTSLSVSGCTALEYLDCRFNNLTTLDVSDCAELDEFWCANNKLSELNMSGCAKLRLYDTIVKDGVITAAKR